MKRILLIIVFCLFCAACAPRAATVTTTITPAELAEPTAPLWTETATFPVQPSPTVSQPTATSLPEPTATETQPPQITPTTIRGDSIWIDHTSVELFERIPDEYIQAASQITWIYRHASVGDNISFGLNCMMNYFPDRADPSQRPSACDRDLAQSEIIIDPKYNRSNWHFELHSPLPNPNPGWYNKAQYFIDRIDGLAEGESYQVANFKFGYVEGTNINDHFFTNNIPDDNFPSVFDLEALEDRHPEITFVWWTMGLARMSGPFTQEFNDRQRAYAVSNGKILFDIADIESHKPDGTLCYGIDRDQNPTTIPSICPEYTNEVFAGHLNSIGRVRLAKAVWVLMAQLAGWTP